MTWSLSKDTDVLYRSPISKPLPWQYDIFIPRCFILFNFCDLAFNVNKMHKGFQAVSELVASSLYCMWILGFQCGPGAHYKSRSQSARSLHRMLVWNTLARRNQASTMKVSWSLACQQKMSERIITKGSSPRSTWGLYTLSVAPLPGFYMRLLFLCTLSLERRNVRGSGGGQRAPAPASS